MFELYWVLVGITIWQGISFFTMLLSNEDEEKTIWVSMGIFSLTILFGRLVFNWILHPLYLLYMGKKYQTFVTSTGPMHIYYATKEEAAKLNIDKTASFFVYLRKYPDRYRKAYKRKWLDLPAEEREKYYK